MLRHLALLAATAASCLAGITWDARDLATDLGPTDAWVATSFSFVNSGSEPVRVLAVAPSCGCTTVQFPAEPVAPGERGRIDLVYAREERAGERLVTVDVVTDDAANARHVLAWRVHVREPVVFAPGSLVWRGGEARARRSARVAPAPEAGLRIESVDTEAPPFAVTWTPDGAGGGTLEVEPPRGGRAAATVRVTALDAAGGRHVRVLRLRAQ